MKWLNVDLGCLQSHPSRVRGLKFDFCIRPRTETIVAPFTGAWIEMSPTDLLEQASGVAPFTGAWIEIRMQRSARYLTTVAPFTGAWIEIPWWAISARIQRSRTLHGCVD